MIVKAIGWVLPRHLLDIWIQFELRHTIPIAKGVTPHQPFSPNLQSRFRAHVTRGRNSDFDKDICVNLWGYIVYLIYHVCQMARGFIDFVTTER